MTTPTELRTLLSELTSEAESGLTVVWSQIESPSEVYSAVMDVAPAIVGGYGDAAATVSAEWYDEYRAQLNIDGSYSAPIPTAAADADTSLAAYAASLTSGADINWDSALALLIGGLTKRILNESRSVLTTAAAGDPQASGWQRTGVGECSFCRMLINRGAVYTQATVNFGAHDNCKCSATPAFGGRSLPVKPYARSERNISDADRARVRAWIAANQ